MGAYDRVYWHGSRFNKRTVAMLESVERQIGSELQVFQGSYNSSVGLSAGTHDGGGAIDCWPNDGDEDACVRAMRRVGFAAWVRNPSQGPWPYHIHGIAIGDKQLSSGARLQVSEYYAGYDGLAGSGRDYHWRPSPIPVWSGGKRSVVDRSNIFRQLRVAGNRRRVLPGVKKFQAALNAKGDFNLPVDGIAGPVTRRAFKRWRNRRDLGPVAALFALGRRRYRVRK